MVAGAAPQDRFHHVNRLFLLIFRDLREQQHGALLGWSSAEGRFVPGEQPHPAHLELARELDGALMA
jgi:hypothetical protein